MPWLKGVKLSEEHKRKIRRSVLVTIPLRRPRRTKLALSYERDWHERKRYITPQPKYVPKRPAQALEGWSVKLPPGVHLIGSGPVRRPVAIDHSTVDSSGRPVVFV